MLQSLPLLLSFILSHLLSLSVSLPLSWLSLSTLTHIRILSLPLSQSCSPNLLSIHITRARLPLLALVHTHSLSLSLSVLSVTSISHSQSCFFLSFSLPCSYFLSRALATDCNVILLSFFSYIFVSLISYYVISTVQQFLPFLERYTQKSQWIQIQCYKKVYQTERSFRFSTK